MNIIAGPLARVLPVRARLRRQASGARGSGTLLNIAVMVVLLSMAAMTAVVARYAVAVHRAQNAADLAALAAAQIRGGGAPGECQQASRIAAQNGARLVACSAAGDLVDFVITVQVTQDVPPVLGLASSVRRTAYAGPAR